MESVNYIMGVLLVIIGGFCLHWANFFNNLVPGCKKKMERLCLECPFLQRLPVLHYWPSSFITLEKAGASSSTSQFSLVQAHMKAKSILDNKIQHNSHRRHPK